RALGRQRNRVFLPKQSAMPPVDARDLPAIPGRAYLSRGPVVEVEPVDAPLVVDVAGLDHHLLAVWRPAEQRYIARPLARPEPILHRLAPRSGQFGGAGVEDAQLVSLRVLAP